VRGDLKKRALRISRHAGDRDVTRQGVFDRKRRGGEQADAVSPLADCDVQS